MRPLTLSKKSNPLGEVMNLQDALTKLKQTKHDSSFENLGEWLNNNSKPRKMKSIYKIAASFILAGLILVACTMPVEQEEEIGYMIRGLAQTEASALRSKLAKISEIDSQQLAIHQVLHEQKKGSGLATSEELTEVVMVLPEANYDAALDKKVLLAKAFDFQSLEILLIEERVERTFFETALHTFDIKVKLGITEEKIVARINSFVHENSEIVSKPIMKTDESGNRFVEFSVNEDGDANLQIKRSVESLYNDLAPRISIKELSPEEKEQLKQEEIEKLEKVIKEKQN